MHRSRVHYKHATIHLGKESYTTRMLRNRRLHKVSIVINNIPNDISDLEEARNLVEIIAGITIGMR